jgi:hypothetical protein
VFILADENVLSQDEREKDVISGSDWKKLEEKEKKKKGFISKVLNKTKKAEKKEEKVELAKTQLTSEQMLNEFYSLNNKFDQLLIKLEKQSGKIELVEEEKATLAQRFSELASQVGELRSVIVTRERSFDKIESEFDVMKSTVASVNPKNIQDSFVKLEMRFVKIESSIEKLNMKFGDFSKKLSSYDLNMEKIKSFDNLFEVLENIENQVSVITDAKKYVDRKVTKVESIFSELSKNSKLISTHESRIKETEEIVQDNSKKLDGLSIKLKVTALKDDLNKVQSDLSVLKKEVFNNDLSSFLNFKKKDNLDLDSSDYQSKIDLDSKTTNDSKNNLVSQDITPSKASSTPKDNLVNQDVTSSKPPSVSNDNLVGQDVKSSKSSSDLERVSDFLKSNLSSKNVSPRENTDDLPKFTSSKEDKKEEHNPKNGNNTQIKLIDKNSEDKKFHPIIDFINKQKSKGMADETIKKMLLNKGWKENILLKFLS